MGGRSFRGWSRKRPDFDDRIDAGRQLAQRLAHLDGEDVVVLGLPRGGVPVAKEIASALAAPLDVILVRKLGVPWQPELAMGAIGEDGVEVLNRRVLGQLGLTAAQVAEVERRERGELERRAESYRGGRPMTSLAGRTALIVDDGVATGSTAQAACAVARAHRAGRVVLAAPVASVEAARELGAHADEVVCVLTPPDFRAVGEFYRDFRPVSDEEVRQLLAAVTVGQHGHQPAADVTIPVDGAVLPGRLTLPPSTSSVVLFAHGSGSSMHSPRNTAVAAHLNGAGHGTLLFDLLTPHEEGDRRNVFDISLLGDRLAAATEWIRGRADTSAHSVGYFGASTGAAAALWAAAVPGARIDAVVSRGGRPDLAGPRLSLVQAPTLLIVGGEDLQVLDLNRTAATGLRCEHEVVVIPGASHLFEEPGAMTEVAELATAWFDRHLR